MSLKRAVLIYQLVVLSYIIYDFASRNDLRGTPMWAVVGCCSALALAVMAVFLYLLFGRGNPFNGNGLIARINYRLCVLFAVLTCLSMLGRTVYTWQTGALYPSHIFGPVHPAVAQAHESHHWTSDGQ